MVSRLSFSAISRVALVALASFCYAQDRGTITGTVSDATGAVIPNAPVRITNTVRGDTITVSTSSAGIYSAPNLIAGTYSISVQVPGFRTSTTREVRVRIGEVSRGDIELQVGQVTESVEVTAATAVLKTDSSDVGSTVSQEAILNLPLQVSGAARDPLAFIKLTPGFAGSTANSAMEYQTYYTLNGGQSGGTSILVDGADITLTSIQSQFNTGVSVEAVEEFKVMASNFSAEYGRSTGGIINLVLKSGTNTFHGSAYEFFRNEKLDARGFFNPARRVNRQNDFGFLTSGPVYIPRVYNGRDRSFFTFAYEGFRFRQGALNQLTTFPTEEFRRGDLSGVTDAAGRTIPIYDPASSAVRPDGGVDRMLFPNNTIPQARFDPITKAVMEYLPLPDIPGRLTNNTYGRQQTIDDNNIYTLKVDHSVTSAHKLAFSYSQTGEGNQDVRPFGPVGGSALIRQETKYARLSHDFVVSPTILNHVKIGFSRRWRQEAPQYLDEDYPRKLGINNVNGTLFPTFSAAGYFTVPPAGYAQSWIRLVDNSFQFNETATVIRGRHALKFGAELRKQQFNPSEQPNGGGFSFGAGMTGLPGATQTTGDGFASFLLGAASSGSFNYTGFQAGLRLSSLGLFFQDDIKVTSRLTLNMGLRYERFTPLSEVNDRLSTFDPNLPNPRADGRLGALKFAGEGAGRTGTSRFQDIYNRALGPRFGLAYQFARDSVIRAGYGIYYQEPRVPTWGRGHDEGFFTSPGFVSLDGFTPAFYLRDDMPTNFLRPPFLDPGFSNGRSVMYADPQSGRPPMSQNWNFGIQRKLVASLTLDAAYVGAKGNHLISRNIIYNQVDPRYLALGSLLEANITSPAAIAAGITKPYPSFSGTVAQSLRPFPQYQTISPRRDPYTPDKTGNSTYHALQMKLEGKVKSLLLLTSYTYSKNLTDNSNNRDMDYYMANNYYAQNGYNRRAEKALAQYDLTHALAMSFLYELPFGPGKATLSSGVASKILGGWSLGGVLIYQSGMPIPTPSPAFSRVPLFAGSIRPDRVADVSPYTSAAKNDFDPGRDLYLNSSAWTSPAPFEFGNAAGMSEARIEPKLNEDLSILKSTTITESVKIEFRAEAFNILNRTQFGYPARSLSRADFGRVFSQGNSPRNMQLGLKLIF